MAVKVIINGKVPVEIKEYIQALTWEHRLTNSGIMGIAAEFAKKHDKEFQKFILLKRDDYIPYVKKPFTRTKK